MNPFILTEEIMGRGDKRSPRGRGVNNFYDKDIPCAVHLVVEFTDIRLLRVTGLVLLICTEALTVFLGTVAIPTVYMAATGRMVVMVVMVVMVLIAGFGNGML